jgi:1,4-alpha-glucan branching enzyme
MPGDPWQQFANLRLLFGFMWAYPGRKLLFMGGELAQSAEWSHDRSLDWHLLESGPYHEGVRRLVADLNRVYRAERALHELDSDPATFRWMDCADADQSVIAFCRFARDPSSLVLCVASFTPVPREGYRVGVPRAGYYAEAVNTDSAYYGGSNVGNGPGVRSEPVPSHGQPHSVTLRLPPLGAVLFRWTGP